MSQLKTGACGHVIAVWDPHTACAGCRPCGMPDKLCEVCDGMSPALKERAIRARSRRLKRAASKRRAGSSDSVSESSLRSTPGPREPSLPPTGVMSPPYACWQEGGACVSPHSNETWDGDRVIPTGKRGKKQPSSQLLLPGEGTPAKVCVSPQPSGPRDVDRAAACVSLQTSVSRDDDAACVSPQTIGSREVDPTSAHLPRGGVPEKGISLSASTLRGDRGSGGSPARSISPQSNEAWVRRQAHRRRSQSPTGRTRRGRSSSSENEGPVGVSPERENHLRSTGNWFTGQSSTEVEAPLRGVQSVTVPVSCVQSRAGPGHAAAVAAPLPVSRARSSPVPGVVAYSRPSYAAGQE